VAFIFSKRTLASASQLARWGLLTKFNTTVHVVPIVVGIAFDFPDEQYLMDLQIGKVLALGSNTAERLESLAGAEVSLKAIADGLVYLMTFLVTFINVAQLTRKKLNKVIAETLQRAESIRGRRQSAVQAGTSRELADAAASDSNEASKSSDAGIAPSTIEVDV